MRHPVQAHLMPAQEGPRTIIHGHDTSAGPSPLLHAKGDIIGDSTNTIGAGAWGRRDCEESPTGSCRYEVKLRTIC